MKAKSKDKLINRLNISILYPFVASWRVEMSVGEIWCHRFLSWASTNKSWCPSKYTHERLLLASNRRKTF